MFFSNSFVEADMPSTPASSSTSSAQQQQQQQQHRRMTQCSNEENDILRELLLDGDFSSPRHFALTPSKPSATALSTPGGSLSKRHHVEISIPQICFDNSTLLRSTPSLLNRGLCMFPSPSPLSQQHSQQLQFPPSSSIINSIISPPRVFIQDFGHFPRPFFHDSNVQSTLESELHDVKQQPPTSLGLSGRTAYMSGPCLLPPPPLPMLTMPPLKNKKAKLSALSATHMSSSNNNDIGCSSSSSSSSSSNSSNCSNSDLHDSAATASLERKQLRCSYPECPNLRRSAGFCNRHSGKVCSVADCNKSALSRGKCPEHGGGSRCKKDGCCKFAQTRGLCKSHGGGRQCNVSGCAKNAHQNRLCRSHGGGKRCDFVGCPKWAQRSGYCCAHTKSSPHDELSPLQMSQSQHAHMDCTSADSSPLAAALPMPSPTIMSPHHLLSMLP